MANLYTTQSALPVGTVLKGSNDSYMLLKTLGQGSFGITYLAKNIVGEGEVEQLFCIKEFFMRDINGRESTTVTSSNREGMFDYYKRKFEQESDHLSRLRHNNIVMVVDAFRANSTSYYVMQYIDGQSLDSLIAAKGRLSTDETVGITRQLGSALSCMHSKGMLHLDVKPANVMMADEKTAILIDFGLSKQYDKNGQPESSTTVGSGTPGYAPIEQANHCEGKDFPVQMDVYALGATMLKMLTGQRPPEASDILNFGFPKMEMKQKGVPQPIIGVVEKAMKPQCNRRYQTMELMMAAMDEAMDEVKGNEEKQKRNEESEATTVDSDSNKGKRKSNGTSKKANSTNNASTTNFARSIEGSAIFNWAWVFFIVSAISNIIDLLHRGSGHSVMELALNKAFPQESWETLMVWCAVSIGTIFFSCWRLHKRWEWKVVGEKRVDSLKMLGLCIAANFIMSFSFPSELHIDGALAFFLIQETLCAINAWMFINMAKKASSSKKASSTNNASTTNFARSIEVSTIFNWAWVFFIVSAISNIIDLLHRGSGHSVMELALNKAFPQESWETLMVWCAVSIGTIFFSCWRLHKRWEWKVVGEKRVDSLKMLGLCIAANFIMSFSFPSELHIDGALAFFLIQETLCAINAWMFINMKSRDLRKRDYVK